MNITRMSLFIGFLFILMGINTDVFAEEVPFTLEDRDRLIRLEATLKEFKDSMSDFKESIGKQFKEFKDSVDKRFEQVDKRFEQVDRRLEFIQNLMLGMLGVFGGLCGVFVGLLLWDRKTFKEKAKEEAIKAVEEGKLKAILDALKEIAKVDSKVADALRKFNLL